MARKYRLLVNRDETDYELYVHNDDTLEVVTPDLEGAKSKYIEGKYQILKVLLEWMAAFSVREFRCKYVGPGNP